MPKVCAVSSCNKKVKKIKKRSKKLLKIQKQKLHYTGKDYSEKCNKNKIICLLFL